VVSFILRHIKPSNELRIRKKGVTWKGNGRELLCNKKLCRYIVRKKIKNRNKVKFLQNPSYLVGWSSIATQDQNQLCASGCGTMAFQASVNDIEVLIDSQLTMQEYVHQPGNRSVIIISIRLHQNVLTTNIKFLFN